MSPSRTVFPTFCFGKSTDFFFTQAEEQPGCICVSKDLQLFPNVPSRVVTEEQMHIPDSVLPESTLKGHQITLETWDLGGAAA